VLLRAFVFSFVVLAVFDLNSSVAKEPHEGASTKGLRLEQALKEITEFDFVEMPLIEAVEFLEEVYEIPILIDEGALDELGLDSSAAVTLQLNGLPLATSLRWLLNRFELAYVNDDGILILTSQERAAEESIARVFDVSDLVKADPKSEVRRLANTTVNRQAGGGGFGGQATRDDGHRHATQDIYETINTVDRLADIVVSIIEPSSWEDVGTGTGAIKTLNDCLVVANTRTVHENIADFLEKLRAVENNVASARTPEERHRLSQP
jgi:hypothetical protein